MNEVYWFMSIKDKIYVSENKFCPAHYIPHKLPFGQPVCHEYCHIHKRLWRMFHHKIFCKFLKCPHYDFMIKKYKENKKNNFKKD